MKRRLLYLGLATLHLGGCAGQVANYYAQAGVPRARFEADVDACTVEMKAKLAEPTYTGSTLVGLGVGAAVAFDVGRQAGGGFDGCMANRGYRLTPLTEEQKTQLAGMSADERKVAAARIAAEGHF